jgi:hypothetical protein
MMHAVYVTLAHLNIKFHLCFALYCASLECVGELLSFLLKIYQGYKKLTNATSLVSVVRHSPLDRDVGGLIPDMGKTQRISKTANFDKFFVSNPFA